MKKYDFDEIIDRSGTNSMKTEAGKTVDGLRKDHIPLWIADMDFACPQPVLDAMKARIDKRIIGYSMPYSDEYYSSVTGWMKRRHNWDIKKETVAFSSGIVTALNVIVQQKTKPGDGVIFCTPAYAPFYYACVNNGRTPVFSKLINDGEYYTFNYDEIESLARQEENKLFFLCNPHNPTGRVWKENELRKVIDICLENGVFVVSDEIHGDLIRKGEKYIPALTLYPDCKNIIACTAPSKTFNIAGNQLSNIIIPDTDFAEEWKEHHIGGMPNPIALDACQAAYNECEDWLEELKEYLDNNFRFLEAFLRENLPKAVFRYPEGTYLAWIDLSAYGSDEELKRKIAANGVFIEYGNADFIRDAEGHTRINIASPLSVLKEAMDRITEALLNK